jgi:hypothetical protein
VLRPFRSTDQRPGFFVRTPISLVFLQLTTSDIGDVADARTNLKNHCGLAVNTLACEHQGRHSLDLTITSMTFVEML